MCKAWSSGATPFPILSNVLVQRARVEVRLTATDLDIEIIEIDACRCRQGRRDHGSGSHAARHRAQTAGWRAAEIEQGPIRPRLGLCRALALCPPGLPPDDFPDLNAGDLPHRFALPAGDLKGLIEKTRFAISTEETRYYLNGIYLHDSDRRRNCCARLQPTVTAWRRRR